ncbi:hypothetical protein ASPZODRAFT_137346 [Penicilliopsis zonata CBS 506.65]|uniref:Carboxylesterase type B domain-containing protein n=1 Tax=Penicilliopsis zonata CBS 506.65 TaxID=1073090 RepID=A0A1L9S588_9EURO|nr:hypothetical protein ASPZODRAFT_137346 [Penicilliopsis zonata CBS 506.65]OJJ42325.1 hypothetical protein ASPZODRAFT_137346 [Penicilliopsis zonata CBS 506.65]
MALLLALLPLASQAHAALYSTVIETPYGGVQGYPAFTSEPSGNLTHWQDIAVWKGIPYGATTAGEHRFKPPRPAQPWTGTVLDAADWGNVCPSAVSTNPNNYTIAEDCLNLNIWSAANSTDAKLPVVMWSYPAQSTAADALFDGGGMADKGVVFVSYNYRTGSFGWLAHPELRADYPDGKNASGNWAMFDQFAALRWIHENIAAFGGDPDRITVMGQSMGSAASQHILNSPLTRGLIVGAIIESGVRDVQDPICDEVAEAYLTLADAEAQGERYMEYLNVSSVAELRALPMDDLITVSAGLTATAEWQFTATLDYYAMPATYYDTLRDGLAADVPVLTGNTKDENGAVFGLNITAAEYLADMNATFSGSWLDRFLDYYPVSRYEADTRASFNAQWTDRSIVGTWLWAQLWATARSSPVYTYFWDHAPPGQDQGAYHESEINYVMNNLYDTDLPWTHADYAIAAQMNAYWVNFIKTGDPNGDGLVEWAATNASETVQQVGNGWGGIPLPSSLDLFTAWFSGLPYF